NEERESNDVEEELEPSTFDASQHDSDEVESREPLPEVGIMPVIRPAVTLPNPDVDARQVAPQIVGPETAPQDPVPTSVLFTDDDIETAPQPLRDLPNEEQEAAYIHEKTDPDTRKFPALTTWRQAFQGIGERQKHKKSEQDTERA